MAKFADIPWYILIEYLETLEDNINPNEIDYESASTSNGTMYGAMNIFVTRGVSQSLNLYAKNENSDYKEISFQIPYNWKHDNMIELSQNVVYDVWPSDDIKRTVNESAYSQTTYNYLKSEIVGNIEQGDEIYSRKDSELNKWIMDNWEDYEGKVNPYQTFIYLGEGYAQDENVLEIYYQGLKDWVKSAVPKNNRSEKFDEFIEIVFDRVFSRVYNRQKNIINLIDPIEMEESFFNLMFSFYDVNPFVSLEEQYRVRLFLSNLIYLLKKRGTYSSLFIIWHILSQGTGNDMIVYDRWHNSSETVPISAFEDYDYTNYYNTYNYPELYDLSDTSKEYFIVQDIVADFGTGETTPVNKKILSTHYKVEFELNNNPFSDGYILHENISKDLYNKWEENRPITRVAHYHKQLFLDSDLSGNEIALYQDPKYDANLYTKSNLISDIGDRTYVFNQLTNGNIWNINHNLDTENLLIETYTLENGYFKYIKPTKIEIKSRSEVEVLFDEYYEGAALLVASDYNVNSGINWVINYNLNSEQILYEVYDINNEKIVPLDATISNNGNTLTLQFTETTPGRCIIKDVQYSGLKYIHNQTLSSTHWEIQHNLNFSEVLFEVYDDTLTKIIPDTVNSTDNTLNLYFSESEIGKCVIFIGVNHIHNQNVASSNWSINHNLNSKDIFFEIYDSVDEVFFPETFEIVDENNVLITFQENVTGICAINEVKSYEYIRDSYVEHNLDQKYVISQYYYPTGLTQSDDINWVINHDLNTKDIVFEVYDDSNYVISPVNAKITDVNNQLTIFFDEFKYGKCIIKDANDFPSFIYGPPTPSNQWIIEHNLGTKDLLYNVYDSENYSITPKNVIFENKDKIIIDFENSIDGYCVIIDNGSYIHTQTSDENFWVVEHNLITRNIFYTVYDENGEVFYPSHFFTLDNNNALVFFDKPTSGTCVVSKNASYIFYSQEDYTTDKWTRYFHDNSSDEVTAIDNDNLEVLLNGMEESGTHRTQVLTVDESATNEDLGYGYIHDQTVASSTWTIDHNLGVVGVILDVYDDNDEKIIPNDIHLLSSNRCEVFLDQSTTGTCSIRAVGSPQLGPFLSSKFNGPFQIKFGYIKDDESHNYENDIFNPLSDFIFNCDESNITEESDKIVLKYTLPKGISGYFNEIGVFDVDGDLTFVTTGDNTYKHDKMKMDFKLNIYYKNI